LEAQEAGFVDGITVINQDLAGGSNLAAAPKAKDKKSGGAAGAKLSESIKQFPECITCKVSVKRMDYLSREYSGDSLNESMEAHLSYLKLINVPTIFDVGCTQANP
jgi:hypothetical protein